MGTADPPVSIVLPTYNRADVVGRSIKSVLNQTYTDFELVIVDDASTDETATVIERFGDDRIRYVSHDENKGAAAARNTGIQAAVGEIIAFQDSDDTWKERKLNRQVEIFDTAGRDVGVVYTGTWRQLPGYRTYIPGPDVEPKEGDISGALLKENFVTPQAAAVRTECFDRVGVFDDRLPPLEDWELWLRISEDFKFRFIDEPLVTAYQQHDSISLDDERKVRSRELIVQKHRGRFDDETLANQYFWVGHGYLKLGHLDKGRRYLRQAISLERNPIYVGALGLSLLGAQPYRGLYLAYKYGARQNRR